MNNEDRRLRSELRPPPLPATRNALIEQRSVPLRITLNDLVEEIHLKLWDTQEYQDYIDAVYDEQAVEGSLAADNIKAAEMIRDYAREQKSDNKLATQKLATISKALGVVLRRYDISRKERRDMIHGENVPGNGE